MTTLMAPNPEYEIKLIPPQPLSGLRIKWLNALIIGATILVWLTLIGGVLVGIGAGVTVASFGGGGGVNFNDITLPSETNTGHLSQDGVYWIDALGDRCLVTEKDANDWCP